jgi:hypothetical protein
MPPEHELNDEELRTLFPNSPPGNAATSGTSADGRPVGNSPECTSERSSERSSERPSARSLPPKGDTFPGAVRGGLTSRCLPPDLLAAFEPLGTRFAHALRRATGNAHVTLEQTGGEWLRWGEFLWTLAADESLAAISPPPWKLSLHTRLLRAIWEGSTAGTAEPSATRPTAAAHSLDRPLTEIERRLARKAIEPLAQVWPAATGSDCVGIPDRVDIELETRDATRESPEYAEDQWVAMICYRLEIGAMSGRMRCVMPVESLVAIRGRASVSAAVPFASSPQAPTSSPLDAAVHTGVLGERWTIELAEQSLPALALEDLRVGDLLRSDHPLDYPLLARAESGGGVVPVRIGIVEGEAVARRVDAG